LDDALLDRLAAHPVGWHNIPWVNAFRQMGKAFVPLWLLALWAAVTGRSRSLVLASVALVLTLAIVGPVKLTTHWLRPAAVLAVRSHLTSAKDLEVEDRASFPSGDTASAFAVATVLAPQVTWVAWPLLYAGAAGIGVLRVTGMNHFPSDVFAGAAVGILTGFLAFRIRARIPQLSLVEASSPARQWALASVAAGVLLGLLVFDQEHPLVVFLKTFWPLVLLTLVYLSLPVLRGPFGRLVRTRSRLSSTHPVAPPGKHGLRPRSRPAQRAGTRGGSRF
jgi:membrane-associated phospholipid phosphatase